MFEAKRFYHPRNDGIPFSKSREKKEGALIAFDPISLADLLGGVPARADIAVNLHIYDELARSLTYPFFIPGKDKTSKEFLVVGPRLSAELVNSVLYFGAPNKFYKLDTGDIDMDWTDLFTKKEHEARRERHAAMAGWDNFVASRLLILGVIQRNFKRGFMGFRGRFEQKDPNDVIIPILRWRENKHIVVDQPSDELRAKIRNTVPQHVHDAERLDNGMGIAFLCAYSPEQTKWNERDGYSDDSNQSTQGIGSTQVLAYEYRKIIEAQSGKVQVSANQNPANSPILQTYESYIKARI